MLCLHRVGRRSWQRGSSRQQRENEDHVCRSYAGTKVGRQQEGKVPASIYVTLILHAI